MKKLTRAELKRIVDCRKRSIKALGSLAVLALLIRLLMG